MEPIAIYPMMIVIVNNLSYNRKQRIACGYHLYNTMKNLIPYLISITSLLACTKEIDLEFPTTESQIVVNGIINPDSTIRINITKTLSLATTSNFPIVKNAIVTIKENGIFLDTLEYKSDGNYVLNYFPKVGETYQLEVNVPGYEPLYATDIIPEKPKFNACHHRGRYSLQIHKLSNSKNFYWISVQQKDYAEGANFNYDSTKISLTTSFYLHSNCIQCDDFNAIRDGGFNEYFTYIRFDESYLLTYPINIAIEKTNFGGPNLKRADSNQTAYIYITNASKNYDRYLKSSMIDFMNNDFNDVGPFTKPVPIFSNIENGTGIFAAYNNSSIDIKPFPCDE